MSAAATIGIIACCVMFLSGCIALRHIDRNPHGRPKEPDWREGYDD